MTQHCVFNSKLLQSIDFWVANFKQEDFPQSAPLLITGTQGCGKSSIISKWLQYHLKSSGKDNNLVIYENPGLNSSPNYAQSLFNILSRLKEEYELDLKLTAKEERLRSQFMKLFENPHSLPAPKQSRKCVIIIIDGIDKYSIGNGKEDSAEWLPVLIPENIRVIYSCDQNSDAFLALKDFCKVINLEGLKRKYKFRVLNGYLERFPDMKKSDNLESVQMCLSDNTNTANPLFLKMLILWSLGSFPQCKQFSVPNYKETPGVDTLFNYAIRFYSGSCSQKIRKVFLVVKLARYGLTKDEIALSSGVSMKLTDKILTIFDCCLIKIGETYSFSNTIFRSCLETASPETISREISLVLEERNNPKRIIELFNALQISKDWKRLKDKLRSLQVFISMYNTQNKVELFTLWVELEKNGFDPVEEYNKVIEEFLSNHSTQKSEDIVLVVLNFFSFFEEYGLFECPKSVNFRNYPLSNKETLEKVNLYIEAEKITGVFNKLPESPLFLAEKKIFELGNRDELREMIIGLNLDNSKKSHGEFFHYKRWFWMQFPLIALSPAINASLVLGLYRGPVGLPYTKELEVYESLVKIINPPESFQKSVNYSRPHTTKPLLNRGNSLQIIRSAAGFNKPRVSINDQQIDISQLNKSSLSFASFKTQPDNRPETYSVNFSLRDTGINTVLLKLNSQLVKFTEVEVKKRFKETQKLQQQYNKLKETLLLKEKQKENLATQLDQVKAKHLEKEEIFQKFTNLQFKTNKNLEKQVLAQAEVEYLGNILESCIKNPPFVQEWNNDLIKAIDICSEYIKSEKVCIEQYEKDTLEYISKYNDLKTTVSEKRSAGTSTLTKLSEKYSINAFINQKIVKGFNRRKVMLMTPEAKEPTNLLYNKIKTRKSSVSKVHDLRTDLEIRLKKLENNVKKLIRSSKDKELRDINGIILKFQQHNELGNQSKELSKSLNELKTEKLNLEEKLNFLKSKIKPQEKEEEPKSFNELSDQLEFANSRLLNIREKVELQEVKIVNVKEVFLQIWMNFGIDEKCELDGKNVKELIRKLANRVLIVDTGDLNKGDVKKSQLVRQRTKVWNAVTDKKLFGKNLDMPK
jgi:hypothetical protein